MRNESLIKLPLPISNENENLETISRNKLCSLFPPSLFEVRQEMQRDKGIDMTVELKQDGLYTNFRFAIQLKTTISIPLKDNSISISISVSNINYLLNYGMPAYYILHDLNSDTFYQVPVNDVFNALLLKYEGKLFPKKFSVKFSKKLSLSTIESIYKLTLNNGELLRKVNSHIKFHDTGAHSIEGILIDSDNEVHSVENNLAFIDKYGFELINNKEYSYIIALEQKSYPRNSATAKFNLVCGLAYFQNSNLFRALELLKLSQRDSSLLNAEAQGVLRSTISYAKYLLGMIDESCFVSTVSSLINANGTGPSFQILKIYTDFIEQIRRVGSLSDFYKAIKIVLNENYAETHIRIEAYTFILKAEARILAEDFSRYSMLILGQIADYKLSPIYKKWEILEAKYRDRFHDVLNYAMEQKDLPAIVTLFLDRIHWGYMKTYINYTLSNWDVDVQAVKGKLSDGDKKHLLEGESIIAQVEECCKTLNDNVGIVHCLVLKCKVLHLAGELAKAKSTYECIMEFTEENELHGLKKEYSNLLLSIEHEEFINSFSATYKEAFKIATGKNLEECILTEMSQQTLDFLERNLNWSTETHFDMDFLRANR